MFSTSLPIALTVSFNTFATCFPVTCVILDPISNAEMGVLLSVFCVRVASNSMHEFCTCLDWAHRLVSCCLVVYCVILVFLLLHPKKTAGSLLAPILNRLAHDFTFNFVVCFLDLIAKKKTSLTYCPTAN